ncbi:MAG: hypothetical protein AUJ11_01700 [Parcubacteria group bacterium CG1_02_44_65]|uniref:Uncharacterized protein n=3 Tax=Candidatus Portnoyibacteriota TaxID=1817913 RepID=A0A2M7YKT4_9BACT|nr:MAG: hypothetical protein AUJ11_01700 [Parcubacteria group bacterium CG1_02_44_65]PIP15835.1 MAG: hypothetical protein COX45_01015 [Candidatus Portnoybacteria bacterium CG23_combo_of_CG06-09_8_20_14_all_44_36]PIZ69391.1 MAG: hypothetical protein COY10_01640 [Candidatus Portnoybacteria bacterium CG_4_10_14_0_2_um_filter_43_36]PJA63590.1 MAG: hypothetical protein CO160_02670 [Candidatus Portnoybacteria bacterium CG_4_9_14_3_um_filter_43_11]PJE59558.1 MAG: hypothetical protein COU84_00155 [Cand
MTNFQKKLLSLLILFGIFSANFVLAIGLEGPIVPCGTKSSGRDCTLCDLWQLASNIITFISFNLAIPLGVFLFVVAGAIFLVSGGSPKMIEWAKTIFTNTVVGLIIIYISWLFIDTLLKTIAQGSFVGAWNQFPVCR